LVSIDINTLRWGRLVLGDRSQVHVMFTPYW